MLMGESKPKFINAILRIIMSQNYQKETIANPNTYLFPERNIYENTGLPL